MKPFPLQLKGQHFVIFRDLKLSERKTKMTNHIFLKEILKAVWLSVKWVPKLINKSFKTMEQKLFPRFETKD